MPTPRPQAFWLFFPAGVWLLMAFELLRLDKIARQRVATSTAPA